MLVTDHNVKWWLLLGSCVGASSIVFILIINSNVASINDMLFSAGVLSFEFAAGTYAFVKIRRTLEECPKWRTGRWQISLRDLLSIVVFFGVVMTLCRAIAPALFYPIGLIAAAVLGCSYAGALLATAREFNTEATRDRWQFAFIHMVGGIVAVLFGTMIQFFVICVLVIVISLVGKLLV